MLDKLTIGWKVDKDNPKEITVKIITMDFINKLF
jgi:hypothetical protein